EKSKKSQTRRERANLAQREVRCGGRNAGNNRQNIRRPVRPARILHSLHESPNRPATQSPSRNLSRTPFIRRHLHLASLADDFPTSFYPDPCSPFPLGIERPRNPSMLANLFLFKTNQS